MKRLVEEGVHHEGQWTRHLIHQQTKANTSGTLGQMMALNLLEVDNGEMRSLSLLSLHLKNTVKCSQMLSVALTLNQQMAMLKLKCLCSQQMHIRKQHRH